MARNRLPYVQTRTLRDGTIRYRGWCMVGTRRAFSPWCGSEDDAYRAALAMRGAEGDGITLRAACDAVIAEVTTKRTAGTVRWYTEHCRVLCRLLGDGTWLHSIKPERLEQLVRERLTEVCARTVNADLRALHRVFAVAIRRGQVSGNPVRLVDRPREDHPPMNWFPMDQLAELLARVGDPWERDVFVLIAHTGIRRAEVGRLRVDHFHIRQRQLVVAGKTRTRVLPLADDAMPSVERLVAAAADGVVVPGGVKRLDEAFKAWRKVLTEPRWKAHALRHSFATALVRAGVRPDVVMYLMGHRSINTTMRYFHESGRDAEQAVRQLRLVPPAAHGPAAQA